MGRMSDKELSTTLQFLKGVGEKRATVLAEELNLHTFEDLVHYYPFRYVDRSQFYFVNQITAAPTLIQLKGTFRNKRLAGTGNKRRMIATFTDKTGSVDCIWFKSIDYFDKLIKPNIDFVLFGKPSMFNNRFNFTHPEIETLDDYLSKNSAPFTPVYSLTEKAKNFKINTNALQNLIRDVLSRIKPLLTDYYSDSFRNQYNLMPLYDALHQVHFPTSMNVLNNARYRLKFDELFFIQLSILQSKIKRETYVKGITFKKVGKTLNQFYNKHLPFDLTNAQKKVIREMQQDMKSGKQMNRLLQGDVGSGKTLVALMLSFIAADNGYQTALMAPTEILAQQHFQGLTELIGDLNFNIDLLTGSVKTKARKFIHEKLLSGQTHLLTGTHALIEDEVQFNKLGLVIIDEQHRFGVEQRARLWKKTKQPPHVLVMTATPIPRTLALTVHGDLDVSVIDELPPGRKPVDTRHVYETKRPQVYDFMRQQIERGRQIYVVFPLIQESEKLDLQNLEDGFERLIKVFPPPKYKTVMIHGQMKPNEKDRIMKDFAKNKAQIMVATTVIEVGVNVPNASIMIIESSQRFGLSQLHQLRGRVGRGAEQSYCILMSPYKISETTKNRLNIMCQTNDGFVIADEDMKIRGYGNIDGTQQSGQPYDFKIANLSLDQAILMLARKAATHILTTDSELKNTDNKAIAKELHKRHPKKIDWRQIS